MFINAYFRTLFFVPFLWIASASAQPAATVPEPATLQMQLDVVVTPKMGGTPVPELRREDFTVLDNKVVQPITSFKAVGGNEVPTEVILVIDAVNTYYSTIEYERGEITKFLRANGGHLAHPTSLAVVTDTGTQIQEGFSTDGDALGDSLAGYTIGLRDLRRSAGFYGAEERFQLSMNALQMLTTREANRPGRKLILWISPEWPLLSGPEVELDTKEEQNLFSRVVALSTSLRQARVTLYSIDPLGVDEDLGRAGFYKEFIKGAIKPSQTQIGDLGLQVLAVQSGGLALNSTGVAALLQESVDDTEAYYELAFETHPSERSNEYHSIEIKLVRSGFVARSREGYYSHPTVPGSFADRLDRLPLIQSSPTPN
jgi:VWFA-related protein